MSSKETKRVGNYLNLNVDTYACTFVYQFHRYYLEDECSDSEQIQKLYPIQIAKSKTAIMKEKKDD